MIKNTRTQSTLMILAAMVLSVGFFIPTVASAQQEEKQRNRPADVAERIEERKSAAMTKIEEKRESTQEKSSEARKTACEKRQTKITAAMTRISTQASKHVETFDKIYERVQGFYEKGQLTVANYDELNAAVSDAQAAASLEASVLSELNVEIDCDNPDVAGTIATYRNSAKAAKESLKTYRSALVELISSLKAEVAQQNNDTEDSTTDSNDTTEAVNETEPNTVEGEN